MAPAPTGRDGLAEYQAAHIPGAVHFDIDTVSDKSSPPHDAHTRRFRHRRGDDGIGNQYKVVVYDSQAYSRVPGSGGCFVCLVTTMSH